MKELLLPGGSLANRISYYHLALLLLSLPFDRFYSHLILGSFGIHTLIHFDRRKLKPLFTWRTMVLQSVFFVTVVSTIYATDKISALREWELDVTIFLIPFLFCINPIDLNKHGSRLLLIFSSGIAATIVYLYISAVIALRFYGLPLSLIFSPAFTNHNFSQQINIHATFFSLQVALALVFMLSLFIKEKIRYNKIFCGFVSLVLLAGIIQLGSKSVFAALFLTINVALPLFLLTGKARKRFILISASLTALLIGVICSSGIFRERYLIELRTDFSGSKNDIDVEPRVLRWGAAVDLIKQAPVIGHGAGSEIPLLKEKYFERKYYTSYLNGLNAHDQYLSLLIKSGIWGLLAYLTTLIFGFRLAIKIKDIMLFSLMTLVAVVSVSENILDMDKGVIFYSLFFTFLVFRSTQQKNLILAVKKHENPEKVATNHALVTSSV
ncbi:O-antigen ligase family protein [Mucilaginibacter ginsenosidivorans]|uniref:O-antigen ligase family protein n=1 Tax=Mucilaginibacter ginsenosidivorans TaxID=398053 RepID=UPI0016522541|nr:O-antigen ligase family protein [Mucilaginibacter ginsenosidivorans]